MGGDLSDDLLHCSHERHGLMHVSHFTGSPLRRRNAPAAAALASTVDAPGLGVSCTFMFSNYLFCVPFRRRAAGDTHCAAVALKRSLPRCTRRVCYTRQAAMTLPAQLGSFPCSAGAACCNVQYVPWAPRQVSSYASFEAP